MALPEPETHRTRTRNTTYQNLKHNLPKPETQLTRIRNTTYQNLKHNLPESEIKKCFVVSNFNANFTQENEIIEYGKKTISFRHTDILGNPHE